MEANYDFFQHTPFQYTSQVGTTNLWKPPPTGGVLKINVDASVVNNSNHFGISVVGRDSMVMYYLLKEDVWLGVFHLIYRSLRLLRLGWSWG